jgi:SAM-dependent methyltransferase
MNYKNQLTLELLYKPENTSYFREASHSYTAIRKFNNYVKKQLIDLNSNHVDKNFIIDLASGQGQDLFKYIERGFKNIIMVEKDIDALSEIINRKYLYINSNDPKLQNNSRIFIKQLDLTGDYKTNLIEMRESSQFIVCNFALHYIVNNKRNTVNFVNLLNKLLEPGGIFIFTAFDGLKIFKLLQEKADENGEWNKYDENGTLTYSIRKKYKTDVFTGSCQNIEVLLPFTGGEYYTEGLINTENLKQEMSKKKINLVTEDSFGIYLEKFDNDKPHFSKKLYEIDKEYASLYNFYIFHKQNKLVNRNR